MDMYWVMVRKKMDEVNGMEEKGVQWTDGNDRALMVKNL
jgi:hypothetical protein